MLVVEQKESKRGLQTGLGAARGENAGLRASPLCAEEVCRQGLCKVVTSLNHQDGKSWPLAGLHPF